METLFDEAAPITEAIVDPGTQLFLRYKAGDEDVFAELVEQYEPTALKLALFLTRNEATAHDMVQEAWVSVIRSTGTFNVTGRFGPWFNRIVANKCHDLARRYSRKPPHFLFSQIPVETVPAEESAIDTHTDPAIQVLTQECVQNILGKMAWNYAYVLWEIDGLGATTKEVAINIGRKESTVWSRLYEARKMFLHLFSSHQCA